MCLLFVRDNKHMCGFNSHGGDELAISILAAYYVLAYYEFYGSKINF